MKNANVTVPQDAIDNISGLVRNHPEALTCSFKAGAVVDSDLISKPLIILIEKGTVSLHRKYDKKLLFHFVVPFVFGVVQSFSKNNNYYLLCETSARVILLDNDKFNHTVDEKNLWKDVLKNVCYLIDVFEESQKTKYQSSNNYELVKGCLHQIWALPQEERAKTSIFKYIMMRHDISRSSVAKFMKALGDGGYLKIKKGVLVELNKLPEKY